MSYGTTQQETDKVSINRITKIPRYFQEETSGYVRPERVNKWPNSMTDI